MYWNDHFLFIYWFLYYFFFLNNIRLITCPWSVLAHRWLCWCSQILLRAKFIYRSIHIQKYQFSPSYQHVTKEVWLFDTKISPIFDWDKQVRCNGHNKDGFFCRHQWKWSIIIFPLKLTTFHFNPIFAFQLTTGFALAIPMAIF